MDKFSLKDSGRGDSEAGDSDCEMGRESPLMGEGFNELFTPDGQPRLHPGVYLSVCVCVCVCACACVIAHRLF